MKKEEISMDMADIQKQNKTKTTIKILWTIICQEIWQPTRNGQISRDIQPIKTESRRNRSFEQTDH